MVWIAYVSVIIHMYKISYDMHIYMYIYIYYSKLSRYTHGFRLGYIFNLLALTEFTTVHLFIYVHYVVEFIHYTTCCIQPCLQNYDRIHQLPETRQCFIS